MNATFQRTLNLPVSAEQAYAWHDRPGALDRLMPPWESIDILTPGDGVRNDTVVEFAPRLGPLKMKWVAKHHGCEPGRAFCDTQVSGPFAHWEHQHTFTSNGIGGAVLTDHIEYRVPGGMVGRILGGRFIRRKLDAMFTYRHNTTRDDLAAHAKHQAAGARHIAVTGAGGLVGSTLVPLLTTGGHRVTRLVRRQAGEGEVSWDPEQKFDASPLDGIDAVVHLAAENIAAARWTDAVKARIRDSRVRGTRTLCEGLARMHRPPRVLVCASAIGIYGDRGDERLAENSPAGSGFLAEVARDWEAATEPARAAGIRVVCLRFGVILSPKDGALARMLLPFKLGAGGRLGSGRQYWSWISIDDAAGAVHHAILTDSLSGAVNAVAPEAVTNAEFTRTLGRVLNRPALVPMPAVAARVALGEMADALLLASLRVEPDELEASGYHFRQPTLESALRHLLGRTRQARGAIAKATGHHGGDSTIRA